MIDGCSRFQALRRVMIPLMGPGILTAGIFMFLFAFQEYLTALVLTDVNAPTVPVFIATQLGQTLPMLQQAGAAAMLLTLPVIAFAFIAQRYLVAGLSRGPSRGDRVRRSPLVLLPGMNCSARLWEPVLARRFGGSAGPARGGARRSCGGVPRRLRRPAAGPAPPRFALAGLSLGAIVALALVRRAPERVARLALLASTRARRAPTSTRRGRAAPGAGQGARRGRSRSSCCRSWCPRDTARPSRDDAC